MSSFDLEGSLSDNYSTLIKKFPNQCLTVDCVEYPNRVGTDTIQGYYKNGWEVLVNDNISKLGIYTSYEKKVVIEQLFVFKKNNYNDWCLIQSSTYGISKKVDKAVMQFANDYIASFLSKKNKTFTH